MVLVACERKSELCCGCLMFDFEFGLKLGMVWNELGRKTCNSPMVSKCCFLNWKERLHFPFIFLWLRIGVGEKLQIMIATLLFGLILAENLHIPMACRRLPLNLKENAQNKAGARGW